MQDFEKKDFSKILKRNAHEMRSFIKEWQTDAFRVYDKNIESIPVTVDIYSRYVLITDYSEGSLSDRELEEILDLASRYLYVEKERVFLKERKKRQNKEQHEKKDQSLALEVMENGLSFEVELLKYADTGLFLDQRLNREMIRNASEDKNVLNLFSYTGSFSVYAAKGGAESVVSVDLSNVYTAWADRNLKLNGFLDRERYKLVSSDAESFLDNEIKEGRKYEIVILDPPVFSNSHKARDFDVQRDYKRYISKIYNLLRKDGLLFFSENLSGFSFDKKEFNSLFKIKEVTKINVPEGFSSKRLGMRAWIMFKEKDWEELNMEEKERLERLSLDEGDDKPMRKFDRKQRKDDRRESPRRDERRGERFSRDREERPRRRFEEDRRGRDFDRGGRFNSRRFDDDRPRRRDDERERDYRSRRFDDQGPKRRDDERSARRFEDDRLRRRFDDDRPRRRDFDRDDRYRDDRRSYRDDDRPYRDRPRRDDYRDRERPYHDDDRRDYRRDDRRPYRDDGENDTSRLYRERPERPDRPPKESLKREKKNAPKPFGFDNFAENKSREKATTFWIQNQEYEEKPDKE